MDWVEVILAAFEQGKTIQVKNNNNEWRDFERQNQLDKPNIDYDNQENWRIKPNYDAEREQLLKNCGRDDITPMMKKDINSFTGYDEDGNPLNYQGNILPLKKDDDITDLKKAANKYATNSGMMSYIFPEKKEAFLAGAEWRAETSYSKEEMMLFGGFCLGKRMKDPLISGSEMWEEWLQKFRTNGK